MRKTRMTKSVSDRPVGSEPGDLTTDGASSLLLSLPTFASSDDDVGELAELPKKESKPKPRRTSVSASSDLKFGTGAVAKKKFPKTSEDRALIIATLKQIKVMQGLNDNQINELADAMEAHSVKAGEHIIEGWSLHAIELSCPILALSCFVSFFFLFPSLFPCYPSSSLTPYPHPIQSH